jgi:cell shape-determining protein MreC
VYAVIFLVVVFSWQYIHKNLYNTIEPAVVGYGTTKQSFVLFPEFFTTYITSHQTLVTQKKDLELAIERLENQVAEKDALLREKGVDTSLVDGSHGSHPLVMYPLMQDVTKIYGTVLLSKGFKDGLTVGEMVYVRGNQVVCTIKEVYDASSLCLLLSASGVVTDGVTSSSSIVLSLVGRGGHFLADIARDTPVTVGEKVYLRSNPNVVIGTVRQIANNNQDTSWHVFVEGAYNPVTSSIFYAQP